MMCLSDINSWLSIIHEKKTRTECGGGEKMEALEYFLEKAVCISVSAFKTPFSLLFRQWYIRNVELRNSGIPKKEVRQWGGGRGGKMNDFQVSWSSCVSNVELGFFTICASTFWKKWKGEGRLWRTKDHGRGRTESWIWYCKCWEMSCSLLLHIVCVCEIDLLFATPLQFAATCFMVTMTHSSSRQPPFPLPQNAPQVPWWHHDVLKCCCGLVLREEKVANRRSTSLAL